MKVKIIDETHQEFNGVIYRKYSDGYYQKSKRRLHREVWKFHNGEIPAGCEIHHVDENPANNDIENLQCLTKTQHRQLHAEINGTVPPLHKEITYTCDYCGKEFVVREKSGKNHFCSEQCASAYHYRSPENQQTRICQFCGKEFTVNKYTKAKCCSNSCAQKFRCQQSPKKESSASTIKKICPVCGKKFEIFAYKKQSCCSHKCASLLMWQTSRADDKAKIRQCEWCGKDFVVKEKSRRFCSKSCATSFANAKRRAERQNTTRLT